MKELLRIIGQVKIAVRRWIPDLKDSKKGRYGDWIEQEVHNLLCTNGKDFLHTQGYGSTGLGANGANYIALTTDATIPAAGDTTLTGEIATGGLARAQGAVTHMAGASTTTIQKTFTATTSFTGVQKCGLFTAISGGTMVHEATFSSQNLANNDQLQVTWTLTWA